MDKVLTAMKAYDYDKYTDADVRRALMHETCDIEDFKALLSPAAKPHLEEMARKSEDRDQQTFRKYRLYLHTALHSQLL